jgi:RimJ/RimL family protein N-acetyltransferase
MQASGFRPPVRLSGRFVELVPLERGHVDALAHAGRDPRIWEFMKFGPRTTREAMAELVDSYLDRQRMGIDLAFTILRKETGVPVGMTRYLDIDRTNQWVEIGGTWLDTDYWRTPFNTEAKFLMLTHAFEVERVHRVQLKTDIRNTRSAAAIERLGAVKEGVLRDHMVLPSGHVRSSVYYGILAAEWPQVRTHLEEFLARPWAPPTHLATPSTA